MTRNTNHLGDNDTSVSKSLPAAVKLSHAPISTLASRSYARDNVS